MGTAVACVAGINVSKDTLDALLLPIGKAKQAAFGNASRGHAVLTALADVHAAGSPVHFCFEARRTPRRPPTSSRGRATNRTDGLKPGNRHRRFPGRRQGAAGRPRRSRITGMQTPVATSTWGWSRYGDARTYYVPIPPGSFRAAPSLRRPLSGPLAGRTTGAIRHGPSRRAAARSARLWAALRIIRRSWASWRCTPRPHLCPARGRNTVESGSRPIYAPDPSRPPGSARPAREPPQGRRSFIRSAATRRFGAPMVRLPSGFLVAGLLTVGSLSGCARGPTDPLPPAVSADPPPPPDASADGPPLFEDVTAASGLAFTYRNGEETADHLAILESLGGGVGLIDFDGDGLLDVYLPGGGGYAGSDRKEIVGRAGKLFRNLGGNRFADVTAEAGLATLGGGRPWFYSHGVAVADYDRDGWPDLLVTGWGGVALLRNVPAGPAGGRRFEDVTARAGLEQHITWATSAAFADLDGDGFPDLYVCQYVDWSWAHNPRCTYNGKSPEVCAPKQFSGLPHKVFRNDGRGGFVDATASAGLVGGGPDRSKGLGVVVVDVDADGKPDVYVANDTVDNFLYINRSAPGAIRFTEVGLTSGTARDDRGTPNGSMGVDAGDPERTGRPSLWVTNYENELHALYHNACQPGRVFFQYRSTSAGIGAIGQRNVGWGTGFLDADLDGWEDLFAAHGHAFRHPAGGEAGRKQLPVMLLNRGGGTFRPASDRLGAYGRSPHLGRGAALGDLDNDGRTDLVVSHMNEPTVVLRGVGGAGRHWVGVRLDAGGGPTRPEPGWPGRPAASGRRGSPRGAVLTPPAATPGCCSVWANRPRAA